MTTAKLWRNRKERKDWARRLRSEDPGLEVVHPHAAGIDVGNSAHYVAVRPDRDPEPVRRFECFTADLYRLAEWLESCGVKTVAMQSTGVYWIPLYEILEDRGFEVYLVNARHTKNLPGRKSDVQESQWLLKLHTYGLLNNSFQPPAEIRVLRTYWRQRAEHVSGAATCIQRMQKALTQMNLQLANVISDLSGVTGQAIVRAIVAGERNPQKLAELSDPRIEASREEVAKSLEGNWRPELVFVLRQEVEMYDAYQRRIAECDQQLQKHLASFADTELPQSPKAESKEKRAKSTKNAPRFDLSSELKRITGVDLTRIDGIDVMVAQTLLSDGHESVEHRSPLLLMVGAVSGQPHQWRQVVGQRHTARGQPRCHSTAAGCQKSDPQPQLPGRPIPPFAHQAGCPQGHHRYGSPPRTTRLSYAEVRSAIRRQRD